MVQTPAKEKKIEIHCHPLTDPLPFRRHLHTFMDPALAEKQTLGDASMVVIESLSEVGPGPRPVSPATRDLSWPRRNGTIPG